MPWWVWALIIWAVVSPLLGVLIGKGIKLADRRDARDRAAAAVPHAE